MRNPKQSIALVVLMSLVSIMGLVRLSLFGFKEFIIVYVLCTIVSIPMLVYNYSICKLGNQVQNYFSQKHEGRGEPNSFRLVTAKIGLWTLYIGCLILALI